MYSQNKFKRKPKFKMDSFEGTEDNTNSNVHLCTRKILATYSLI
jgi:hypothetical protein